MATKHRFRNKYRLELREDDSPPVHVHLVGGNFDVVINLETLNCTGTFPRELRKEVMEWVTENREELIEEWNNGINETTPPGRG